MVGHGCRRVGRVEWGLGHCSVRRVARYLAAGGAPVYGYIFEHAPQHDATDGTYGWRDGIYVPGNTASVHTSEIIYAFGGDKLVSPGEEAALARKVGEMWTNFAVSGAPTAGGEWPRFEAAGSGSDALSSSRMSTPRAACARRRARTRRRSATSWIRSI